MRVLLSAPDATARAWRPHLTRLMPEISLLDPSDDPALAEAILYAPNDRLTDFSPYKNVMLVQSLWAGVERIVHNPTLTQRLSRMVDPGLRQGMVEYCVGWALRAHLGMDRYAQDGVWRNHIVPPLADARRVAVLGMGELGGAVAEALSGLGFDVHGWARRPASRVGIQMYHGQDGLQDCLDAAQIVITLLPDTPQTRSVIDKQALGRMAADAWLINPGRGSLIDEDALLAALDADNGIGHAVLDVFQHEPLPPTHPFWSHPKVTVTPHIASETRPETAAIMAVENLRRARDGKEVLHLVDRTQGY